MARIKTKKGYVILTIIGLVVMGSGVVAEVFLGDSRYLGFASGLGSAGAALGAMNLILLNRKPETIRQQEINDKDERLIQIREKSAYSTFFITLFGMAALEVVFLFTDSLTSCILVIGLMAVHVVSFFGFLNYYSQRL